MTDDFGLIHQISDFGDVIRRMCPADVEQDGKSKNDNKNRRSHCVDIEIIAVV